MFLVKKRLIFLIALCLYSLLFLLLILYWMYTENARETGELQESPDAIIRGLPPNSQVNKPISVEIWGKASISLYLWKHILKGHIDSFHNGFMNTGNLTLSQFEFNFKNGPAFIQTTVPQSVQYLVLVLNGRTLENVKVAEEWLKYLPKLKQLKRVCVVLLGNEQCDNGWIVPYMTSKGGKINAVFLVYDSTLVDNREFYQWPLGVAEYRGFSNTTVDSIRLLNKRPYTANFVGTVYKGSSRETLVNLIKEKKWSNKIKVIGRNEWVGQETHSSLQQYIEALQSSDLTLSPVGFNSECYRIYEALSFGSMPVVEDVVTPGNCDHALPAPLRLLKQQRAPVLWLKNWSQLAEILKAEEAMTFQQVIDRRIKIINWYKRFKHHMQKKFLQVLKDTFL